MLNYNEYSKKAHQIAVNHGFWDARVSNEHCLMLTCTEIAEIIEADRKNRHAKIDSFEHFLKANAGEAFESFFEEYIKDTIEDEFADTFIRLCDLAGELEIDFNKLNPCNYHRAFDRFTMTENAFGLIKGLSKGQISICKRIQFGLDYITNWAKSQNINFEWHVRHKMKYNESRPAKHGKKY